MVRVIAPIDRAVYCEVETVEEAEFYVEMMKKYGILLEIEPVES